MRRGTFSTGVESSVPRSALGGSRRCRDVGGMDMDSYRILRSTGRYVVLITRRDGKRRWSPWFSNKTQAEAWIVQQTKTLPNDINS